MSNADPASGRLLPTTLSEFEQRMWIACNLVVDERAYLYYGTRAGECVGLQRDAQGQFEIRIRERNAVVRSTYETTTPGIRGRLIRSDNYDPRLRPWYAMATEEALAAQIDRLSATLDEPMGVEGHTVLSGGALHLQDGVSLDQLIQVAAARMYERKGLRASERT